MQIDFRIASKMVSICGRSVLLVALGCDDGVGNDLEGGGTSKADSDGVPTENTDDASSTAEITTAETTTVEESMDSGDMEPEPSCDGSVCWQDCSVLANPPPPPTPDCHRKNLEDYEPWQCPLTSLCPRLEIQTRPEFPPGESFMHIDMDIANCFLEALRGDRRGKLEFSWQVVNWTDGTTDGGADIFLFGDRSGLIDFGWSEIFSNCISVWTIKTQRILFRPAVDPYYEQCLRETDVAAKIDCILGTHEIPRGDIVFPWLGEDYRCNDLPAACPEESI